MKYRTPVDYGENGEKYFINKDGLVPICYYCTDCDKYLWETPHKRWIKPHSGLYGFDPIIHKKK